MKKVINLKKCLIFVVAFGFAALMLCTVCACAPANFNPQKKATQLNKPDILESGTLKVGINYGNPPLAGETTKSSGIDIDVAAALADELGLDVQFVDVGSASEDAIENKKVDMVMGLTKSSNTDEVWKSEVYAQSGCALFAKSGNVAIPSRDTGDKFSTQLASPSALACQAQYDASDIKLEKNLEAAFDSLEKGDVKYVAADALIGTYLAKDKKINANIIALLAKPSGYCIGVPASSKNLTDKIAGALDNLIKGGMIDVIEKRWLGKTLKVDNVELTPEGANQVDAAELEEGVYGQTDTSTPGRKETL